MLIHRILLTACVGILLATFDIQAQITAPPAYNSDIKINYIRTWEVIKPTSNSNDLNISTLLSTARITTQYFDGLGRLIQTTAKQGSMVTGNSPVDMVSPVVYDEFGRERYKYIPFVANNTGGNTSLNDGLFKLNPFQQDSAFNKGQYPEETFYYNKTNFEPSPLNRVKEVYATGNSWAGSEDNTDPNTRRSVSTQYLINTISDSVRIWTVSGNSFSSTAMYAANQLYKTVTSDEHKRRTVEYKDKEGRTILKKVQISDTPAEGHTGWLCTYYVYDDLGLLRLVIQPKAVEQLTVGNWLLNQVLLDELCFRYEYDWRSRMIIKKVPGAGEVWMVYDTRDRLVLSQDANLRLQNKWLFTKYDGLNRVIMTGLYVNSSYITQSTMQGYLNGQSLAMYETYTPVGALPMYTLNQSFPVVTYNDILTATYYDDYGWTNGVPADYRTFDNSVVTAFYSPSNTIYPYPQPIEVSNNTRGLVTGTIVKTLDGTRDLVTTSFYDEKGRVIQVKAENYTGACDVTTTQYSFIGQPLMTYLHHLKYGTNSQRHDVLTKIDYDDLGRVLTIRKTIGSNINGVILDKPEQVIVSNEYDALGQLKKKTSGSPAIEILQYDYNIRGWMLGANRNFIKDIGNNKFGFELGYDKAPAILAGTSYSNQQYNGNISGTTWKSAGDNEKRKYDFTYDPINRLTRAEFTQYTNNTFNTSAGIDFSAKRLSYDANGNIQTMDQRGWKLGGSSTIDSLLYTYKDNSNQLKNVFDRANDPQTQLGDFRSSSIYMTALSNNKTTAAVDYTYDNNGNLVKDLNKDIGQTSTDGITYNYLNLPQTITVRTTGGSVKGTITYTYDAGGNKLKKLVQETGKPDRATLCIGGIVYENDTLQFIGHEEGRIRYAKTYFENGDSAYQFVYDYFLKDHLGNVRMVLTEQKDTSRYVATMEAAYRAKELKLFANIPETSYPKSLVPGGYPVDGSTTNPNDSLARVNGSGKKIGPSLVLRVMSGDRVDLGVKSFYRPQGSPGPNSDPLADILSSLAEGIVGSVGETKGTLSQLNNISTSPLLGTLNTFRTNKNPNVTGKPKAYLNWILFDEQFKYVEASSGAIPVNNPDVIEPLVPANIPITKNGFLYIYLSNETQNWDVFFNDLSVRHFTGSLIEETHYYPFGLTMAGISSKAFKPNYRENKYRFNKGSELQNKEFSDGSGLEWYDSHARNYDPQLGRFMQVDPKTDDEQEDWGQYQFGLDNPILYNDPSGECPWCLIPAIIAEVAGTVAVTDAVIVGTATTTATTVATSPGLIQKAIQANADLIDRTGYVSMPLGFGSVSIQVIKPKEQATTQPNTANNTNGTITLYKPKDVVVKATGKKEHGNKLNDKPAEGYTLRDKKTGEVKKYGETTRGEDRYGKGQQKRYSKNELEKKGVEYRKEERGTKKEMHQWQHNKINEHKGNNDGKRPDLNKNDY